MFHCVYIHSVYVYTTLSLSYPFSKYSPNKQIFSHRGPACFAYPMKFHPSANHRKDKINHLAINKTPSSCWPSELCDPDNPCWAAEQQQINPRSPPRGLASKLTHAVRDLSPRANMSKSHRKNTGWSYGHIFFPDQIQHPETHHRIANSQALPQITESETHVWGPEICL